MNPDRASVALVGAVLYGFVALLVLEFLGATFATLVVMVAGDHTYEPEEWWTGLASLLGATLVFAATFWRVYHSTEPTDLPTTQTSDDTNQVRSRERDAERRASAAPRGTRDRDR